MKDEAILDDRTTRPSFQSAIADPWQHTAGWWRRILQLGKKPRRLRVCETLPLGERRFVAVVEFEQFRFLLGGTSASLVLLARLGDGSRPEIDEEAGPVEDGR